MLTYVFAYTFSKSYEQNHFLNTQNPGINNVALQGKLIKELDNQDIPQSVALSGIWDLPIGNGSKFLSFDNRAAGYLLNDWSLDFIFTYVSGYPTGKPNALFSCGSYNVANQNPNQWFNNNPACYSDYSPYMLRNVEDRFPNIRDPQKPQLNLAL